MNKFFVISITAFSILISINSAHAVEPKNIHDLMVYEFEGEFEYARNDLIDAIKSRGMVISYRSHAKTMLDRTADAVGITETAYPTGAEIILFCKTNTSHKLIQANPHYLALCPYAISVYDIQNATGKVFLSYRKPPGGIPEYEDIENLLKDIINEVIGE
ncbi:MAG: DUF302 domain-containing protein [Gammaproteobacteria bacterium]|nr:DUF302 domain-containing protein [Gammaproteobacteria bacterium]